MKKFIGLLILAFTVSLSATAQETKENTGKTIEAVEWVRVQSDTGELSVEMPSSFVYFYDKDGFRFDNFNFTYDYKEMRSLSAAAEKTVMSVEIYKVPSPKKHLEELIERQRLNGLKSDESKDGFTIKQILQTASQDYRTKKETQINFVTRLIASKSFLYVVTVANRGAQSPVATRFLSSIRLNQAETNGAEKIIKLSSLKPLTIEQIAEMVEGDDKKSNPSQAEKPDEKTVEKPENPIMILTKPSVNYTDSARNAMVSGTVRLRVTFGKDGRISKIGVLKSLPNGLTRNAFFAALRIKFLPQETNGEFETVTKTVEYSFSVG